MPTGWLTSRPYLSARLIREYDPFYVTCRRARPGRNAKGAKDCGHGPESCPVSDAKTNVLVVIHAPVYGGPHNTIAIMADLLEAEGVHATVLLPEEALAAAARLRDAGLNVVTLPLHRVRALPDPGVHARYVKTLRREIGAIARLIEARRINVVSTMSLPNLHGPLAARKANVACVWEIVDSFAPPMFRRMWMPIVLHLAQVVMTTGTKIAEAHPGTTGLGDRWVNFYPCVDVERFRSDPAVRQSARAELGLPQGATVVGNVSNLNLMKGHTTFIRAAAELRKTHPDVRFVILGDTYEHLGDYYRALWSEAERLGLRLGENLIVVNPDRRVSQLAQAFDVFWMTSEPRSEGLPTVIGEAKALGLPIVTTDVGSTSECVTDGVSGYVVPALKPQLIAAATRSILDDGDRRASMGAAARREAEEQFAAQHGARSHRLAFEKAISYHTSLRRAPGSRAG